MLILAAVIIPIVLAYGQLAQARTSLGDFARGRENGIQAGKFAFKNGGSNAGCPHATAYCAGWNEGYGEGYSAANKLAP